MKRSVTVGDDCDGLTDEELGETDCGVGQCAKTVINCVDGLSQTCDPNEGSSEEVCDGIDNDCDGLIDANDPDLMMEACELQDGVCDGAMKPAEYCQDGSWLDCDEAVYLSHNAAYEADVERAMSIATAPVSLMPLSSRPSTARWSVAWGP